MNGYPETKYKAADDLLNSILAREQNPQATKHIYGSISENIDTLILKTLGTEENRHAIRNLNKPKKTPLQDIDAQLEENTAYTNMQTRLLQKIPEGINKDKIIGTFLPTDTEFKKIYGIYHQTIKLIYEEALKTGRTRENGFPIISHWNRIGGALSTIKELKKNKKYAALGAAHDFFEDLFTILTMNNNQYYKLRNEKLFFDTYFGEELHEPLRHLSNFHGMIFEYSRRGIFAEGKSFTSNNIKKTITKFGESTNLTDHMSNAMFETNKVLEAFVKNEEISKDTVRMLTYELYLNTLEKYCVTHYPNLFIVKLMDRNDNNKDGDSSTEKIIRNMKKTMQVTSRGKSIIAAHKPGATTPEVMNLAYHIINEMEYNTLEKAKKMIISDILEPNSKLDFMAQALTHLKELDEVFFIKN